jgi:predicted MFS family arabinose efflux permease
VWMGVIALLALIPAIAAIRFVPAQKARDSGLLPSSEMAFLAPTFGGYLLYGAGYVSYMTFIIVLLRQNGGGPLLTAIFWIVLGLASVVGTLLWGRVLSRLKGGMGPALVSIVVLIGALPVLIWQSVPAAFVSAIIFGGSFMAGPAAVTMLARKLTQPQVWTAAISALTVAFAVGQAVGPLVSGYVSDLTGSVSAGLWLAPILLIIAAILALFQRSGTTRLVP